MKNFAEIISLMFLGYFIIMNLSYFAIFVMSYTGIRRYRKK